MSHGVKLECLRCPHTGDLENLDLPKVLTQGICSKSCRDSECDFRYIPALRTFGRS